jgi:hypothetical protein
MSSHTHKVRDYCTYPVHRDFKVSLSARFVSVVSVQSEQAMTSLTKTVFSTLILLSFCNQNVFLFFSFLYYTVFLF